MKLFTPEISWHQKEPVLSVDFCPATKNLASSGADFTVKIWKIKEDDKGNVGLDFLSNLEHHTKPVNAVRFSPKGNILASGGDDYVIIIWARNQTEEHIPSSSFGDSDQVSSKESWSFTKVLRGHVEDVYDIAWSPDGTQLISGSVDNSAIIWDVVKGQKLSIMNDHHHYIQGVTWDPKGQLVATHSSDRSCKIYNTSTYHCLQTIHKTRVFRKLEADEQPKQFKLFLDETMQSFFRRCSFSPDGSLLVLPGGIYEAGGKVHKTTYVYVRGHYSRPAIHLPSLKKPSIAVKFCPVIFDLVDKETEDKKSLFKLPYRMVFAVATLDSVTLYDTQHLQPFGHVSNIHYASITDLAWSSDGKMLVVSSMDGYCSFLVFDMEQLGEESSIKPLEMKTPERSEKSLTPEKSIHPPKDAMASETNNQSAVSKSPPSQVQSPKPTNTPKAHNTLDKFFTPSRKRKADETSPVSSRENIPGTGTNTSAASPDCIITIQTPSKKDFTSHVIGSLPKQNQIPSLKNISNNAIPKPQINVSTVSNVTNEETKSATGKSEQPRRIQLTTLCQKSPRRVPLITLSSKPSLTDVSIEANTPTIGFDTPTVTPNQAVQGSSKLITSITKEDSITIDDNQLQEQSKTSNKTICETKQDYQTAIAPPPRRVSFITLPSPKKNISPTKQTISLSDDMQTSSSNVKSDKPTDQYVPTIIID